MIKLLEKTFEMKKKAGMKGLVSLDEVMVVLPEEERKKIEARGAELNAKIERRMKRKKSRKGQVKLLTKRQSSKSI